VENVILNFFYSTSCFQPIPVIVSFRFTSFHYLFYFLTIRLKLRRYVNLHICSLGHAYSDCSLLLAKNTHGTPRKSTDWWDWVKNSISMVKYKKNYSALWNLKNIFLTQIFLKKFLTSPKYKNCCTLKLNCKNEEFFKRF
jgi:hypothetical protein